MYRVIMVPVDGSAFSRAAVFQALRLASKEGARLRLVRVASPPVFVGGPEMAALDTVGWKTERANILGQLYQLAAECRASADVDVTTALEEGSIADALRVHALQHHVDLIVMSTHARGGLARVFLGSVADSLIRETGLPVLVVRPPSLATEMESGPCFKRILIALDGSPLAERSLRPALRLAELEGAEIHLLRIVPSDRNIPLGELQATVGPARASDVQDALWYVSGVRILLGERDVRVRTAVRVADDIPSAILEYAETHNIDVIAIGTHGRGGLARVAVGSVADRLVREANISVLAIHPEKVADSDVEGETRPMFAAVMGD